MEILTILLLFTLVALMAYQILKSRSGRGNERMEAVLSEKLNGFSENIRQTMDKTREEVERSKDFLSGNAIKTLEHINNMNGIVNSLVKQQEKAQQLGQSLEYLLQSPKLRGDYGETILEEMLDRVLPKKGMWERQYEIEGGERVDAVVKYKDVVVPIDSKFPKEDYQKYLAATSPEEKKKYWSDYEKTLKIQINSIKDKYIKPEKGTTEFALLFIPSESIYYETIAEKNHVGDICQIYEYATSRKVIPVSPNTFYAFLHVILLGIRNIEIAKEARKLQSMLSGLERDFGFFYNNFENIGKSIEKAARVYGAGEGQIQRFKKNLDSVLKLEISREDASSEEGGVLSQVGNDDPTEGVV